jgi:hypothetical protein
MIMDTRSALVVTSVAGFIFTACFLMTLHLGDIVARFLY